MEKNTFITPQILRKHAEKTLALLKRSDII